VTLTGRRVHLDTNIFICGVEQNPAFGPTARRVLTEVCTAPGPAHTSGLTLAEVLVGSFRTGDLKAITTYDALFADASRIDRVPVSANIPRSAAEPSGGLGFKLPDAVHVASAVACDCEVIVSLDRRLKAPPPSVLLSLTDLSRP
jgi:predicted nucleic acid-binding protein